MFDFRKFFFGYKKQAFFTICERLNATGVLLHKAGYSADTILNLESISNSQLDSYDCLLYPTASRSIPSKDAYDRVFEATKKIITADTKVFAKRIDSTLRGNLGSETDAMLDHLEINI